MRKIIVLSILIVLMLVSVACAADAEEIKSSLMQKVLDYVLPVLLAWLAAVAAWVATKIGQGIAWLVHWIVVKLKELIPLEAAKKALDKVDARAQAVIQAIALDQSKKIKERVAKGELTPEEGYKLLVEVGRASLEEALKACSDLEADVKPIVGDLRVYLKNKAVKWYEEIKKDFFPGNSKPESAPTTDK